MALYRSFRSHNHVRRIFGLALGLLALLPALHAIKIPQDNTHLDSFVPYFHGTEFEDVSSSYPNAIVYQNNKIQAIWRSFNGSSYEILAIEYDLDGNVLRSLRTPIETFGLSIYVDTDYAIGPDELIYVFSEEAVSTDTDFMIRVYDWNGDLVRAFAPEGSNPGEFDPSPQAFQPKLTISPDTGRIYALDGHTPEVTVFASDGTFVTRFDISGILASTLEDHAENVILRPMPGGTEEVWVQESASKYFKIFDADGNYLRLFDATGNNGNISLSNAIILNDDLYLGSSYGWITRTPAGASEWDDLGQYNITLFSYSNSIIGQTDDGRLLVKNIGRPKPGEPNRTIYGFASISAPTLRTFDPAHRNAVPDPFVSAIKQRPGSTVMDIDFRVDDGDNATVTVGALAFADGEASLLNVVPMTTLVEGTDANLGAGIATGEVHRLSWDAGVDWNVDFGDVKVAVLARDDRSYWFDVHLVEIPADGNRPAVTITRNPLDHDDFLAQWFWLLATKDASINLVDGSIFGAGGDYNGVLLANGTTTTAPGREFLLARDGLRVATEEEYTRAREGATPGFTAQLEPRSDDSVIWLGYNRGANIHPRDALPQRYNEYGIETLTPIYSIGVDYWYVVVAAE